MNKTNKILVRLGVEDIIIPIEDIEKNTNPESINTYFVGYEDEDGNEYLFCDSKGNYFN